MPIHAVIALFEQKAQVLDAAGMDKGQDKAIAMLAEWMAMRKGTLSEDDWLILSDIGAILYQDRMRRGKKRQ